MLGPEAAPDTVPTAVLLAVSVSGSSFRMTSVSGEISAVPQWMFLPTGARPALILALGHAPTCAEMPAGELGPSAQVSTEGGGWQTWQESHSGGERGTSRLLITAKQSLPGIGAQPPRGQSQRGI